MIAVARCFAQPNFKVTCLLFVHLMFISMHRCVWKHLDLSRTSLSKNYKCKFIMHENLPLIIFKRTHTNNAEAPALLIVCFLVNVKAIFITNLEVLLWLLLVLSWHDEWHHDKIVFTSKTKSIVRHGVSRNLLLFDRSFLGGFLWEEENILCGENISGRSLMRGTTLFDDINKKIILHFFFLFFPVNWNK